MENTRRFTLRNSPQNTSQLCRLEFDKEYVFAVGSGADNVTVLCRKTGRVVWTLAEHIRRHGPPTCFHSALWHTDDRSSFLLRDQVQVPAPDWVQRLAHTVPSGSDASYVWARIAIDSKTETLLVLGESLFLIMPRYREVLRGAATQLYMHLSLREVALQDNNDGHDNPSIHTVRPEKARKFSLAAGHGRAAVVLETLLLFDFQTLTNGRTVDGRAIRVPFAVYEWTTSFAESTSSYSTQSLLDCDSVALDTTGVYCITTEMLELEMDAVNVVQEWEVGRQEMDMRRCKTVSGFHFGHGAIFPERVSKNSIARPIRVLPPRLLNAGRTPLPTHDYISELLGASDSDEEE